MNDSITWDNRNDIIGRRIKVIYSGSSSINKGDIHTVTSIFQYPEEERYGTKTDRITVGVTVNGSHCWVQAYELLPKEEPIVNRYSVRTASPLVGWRVRAYDIPGYRQYEGTEVTIDSVAPGAIGAEFPDRSKPDDTIRLRFTQYEIVDGHTLTVSRDYRPSLRDEVTITGYLDADGIHDNINLTGIVTGIDGDVWTVLAGDREYISGPGYVAPLGEGAPTVDALAAATDEVNGRATVDRISDLIAEVDTVKAEVARLEGIATRREETIQRLQTEISKWSRDFNRYAERILEEAVNRDWCAQYEDVMSDIQGSLEIAEIPEREQEFEVEVEVRGSISTTTTVTVTARSQDDAEEIVKYNIDDYVDTNDVLNDAVRYNGWDDIETEVQ